MVEVPVAAVAEAVAGHVDRRTELPSVEEAGELLALALGQKRAGDGEAAFVQLAGEVVPRLRVDALRQ
jgi:hypothetical protein